MNGVDPVTLVWARTSPGTAFAAGLEIGVGAALDLEAEARTIVREARLLREAPGTTADEALVLRAVETLAEQTRPVHALREILEWIRALVYLEKVGTPEAERSDSRIGGGFEAAVRRAGEGTLPEKILARSLVAAIHQLAADAGLVRVTAASSAADALLGDVPRDLDWPSLQAQARSLVGAMDEPGYASLVRHAYGLVEPVGALEARVLSELETSVARLQDLARATGASLPGRPSLPEDVMRAFEALRSSDRDALELATSMTQQSIEHLEQSLIALGPGERAVLPEATPAAMVSLVTEGEEYLAGGLTPRPRARCFITPAKCGSVYTLANVLFHELAHCWNMLMSCRHATALPPPLRVAGTLGIALAEGIATRREREVYELYRDADAASPCGRLFDFLHMDRATVVREFEFDTQYWWVARLIRALFDFRVQTGRQGYVEFVQEMSLETGLSPARLHSCCFSFFERAGYAPCYAVGVLLLDDLERAVLEKGWSRRDFATRISSAGMVPPALWPSCF